MNERPIISVLIAPIKTKNSFLSEFLEEKKFPIIAACPLPNAGRKLHKGDAIIAPINGLLRFIFGFVIICSGIFCLFFMLIKIDELPKSPLNNGRRGWFKLGKLKIIHPKIPVKIIANNAYIFFLSKKIKDKVIKISKYGINIFINPYVFSMIKIEGINITLFDFASKLN